MFLLRNQNSFTKFCNYGCWCLPEDSGTVGYGKPVDAIDAACKEYTTCFNCVHKQESCDEELYKMTGKMDNGERYLLCSELKSWRRNHKSLLYVIQCMKPFFNSKHILKKIISLCLSMNFS